MRGRVGLQQEWLDGPTQAVYDTNVSGTPPKPPLTSGFRYLQRLAIAREGVMNLA